ncbi:hypothetical protein EN859_017720 [Mesorhizobium sp. M00.F.Ca.ET.216.01.1.1]|nr:hypothetical protein EN859_017720 [Mesorhizobium sp. M00.F.Ca.ET.216.01.1.1]
MNFKTDSKSGSWRCGKHRRVDHCSHRCTIWCKQHLLLLSGLGIGSAPVASVSDLLDAGKLSRVLPTWSTPLEALYLYFPSRRYQPAALRAFIAFLKGRSYAPLHLHGRHDGNVDERDGRVG